MDDRLRDSDPIEDSEGPPRAQPPIDDGAVRLGNASHAAAGMGALVATLEYAKAQTGFVRGTHVLALTNQESGFDCPGCAWPEPHPRETIEFCENGAKAVLSEATNRRVGPELFARKSVAELARESDHWLNEQGRLTHPMVLREGATHYEPIGWDGAFELIAAELRGLASPDEALFYTSGRTSNEAAFLYQLFVRAYGTNNLPDCSNMCHESSGAALNEVLGVGKGTVQLSDFEMADAIFIVGQNPGTNHPRMLTTLEAASERGAMIVSVNPLAEVGTMYFSHPQSPVALLGDSTPIARMHVPVRINGDVAFFQGVMKAMLEEETRAPGSVVDREFVERYTLGYDELVRALRGRTWAELERGSGVGEAEMRAAARVAIESRATIVTWAMGLTQHVNAVDNIQAIVDFLLLRGMVGKPGAGVCPVRGHSNVQGDRTMGIWEKMADGWLDGLAKAAGFEPPRAHGLDTVDAIQAMLSGKARVFLGMGGNFLSAAPDTERTAEALRSCSLTVHVSTKLHRSHLVTGARGLILPCLGRTEIDVQAGRRAVRHRRELDGRRLDVRAARLRPASEHLLSETRIVARLAQATLGPKTGRIEWSAMADDYDRIRALIERVVPGCKDYRKRVREPGGFALYNAASHRVFETKSGKAHVHGPRPAAAGPRARAAPHDDHPQPRPVQHHGLRARRPIPRRARRKARRPRERGRRARPRPRAGAVVDITSHFSDGERHARRFKVKAHPLPRGCCATYFPEANVLVPIGSVARKSNTPASKSVVVTLSRSAAL